MDKKGFFQKWKEFLSLVFFPGSILPIVVAAFGLYGSFNVKDEALANSLAIFASILTGIAGIFIKDDWDRIRGDSLLEKKGRSALRNLEAINQQIVKLRGWIREFQKSKQQNKIESLKEVDRHLSALEFNIRSGVEDWVDIEPALRKVKETVSIYQDVLKSYIEELLKNKRELLQAREDKDKERLKNRIKELEKSVKELKGDQPQVFGEGLRVSGLPGSTISLGIGNGVGMFSSLGERICGRCGKRYKEDITSVSVLSSNLCPSCEQGSSGSSILSA
ncbi:MAG: hypothetical protein AAB524_01595 [Patescibacteria group bacterium]